MTAKEKLIEAKARIYKRLEGFKAERKSLIERRATQIELALIDDLISAYESRISELELYLYDTSND